MLRPHRQLSWLQLTPLAFLLLMTIFACSGPQPLSVAIRPRDEQTYQHWLEAQEQSPKRAWFAWQAQQRAMDVAAVAAADAQLSGTKNPFQARRDPQAVSLGAVIFKAHCASCHGEAVDGRGPAMAQPMPTMDFHRFSKRFAVTLHGGAPKAWFRKIHDGVEGPQPMPAFKDSLAREQIWLAVTYLQSLDVDAKDKR